MNADKISTGFNFKVGDFCMFTPPDNHPLLKRKLGRIVELGPIYSQDNYKIVDITVEDSYGRWKLKNPIGPYLSSISGPYWQHVESQKDVEFFRASNLLPYKVIVRQNDSKEDG